MGTSKKKSWYAVKKGRNPGLFTSWDECRKQVIGFAGALYKGFYTKEEAEAYLGGIAAVPDRKQEEENHMPGLSVYVDGSYMPFWPDRYSYGIVYLENGRVHTESKAFIDPANAQMRNVAGEAAGARRAMEYCMEHGLSEVHLFYDYKGIECWCTGEWKANKEETKALKAYYDEVKEKLHVVFHKVKSHTGVKYNEMADRLAKKALEDSQ